VRCRPDGAEIEPAEWRRYLYLRRNPAGWTTETWFHQAGCRRFLTVERHTLTNEIRAVRPPLPDGRR
jgi:heterotetrameric sarcosine oxidase delta subunit